MSAPSDDAISTRAAATAATSSRRRAVTPHGADAGGYANATDAAPGADAADADAAADAGFAVTTCGRWYC